MKTILVVDDEPKIVRALKAYLEDAGFRVVTAADGQACLVAFRHEKPDLVLLDLMLPVMDGREVCQRIRRESTVPVIMVTARDEEVDRLIGFELGADDYIVKPFSPREVVARVRAVLRRAEGTVRLSEVLRVGDILIDIGLHQVFVAERSVNVTPTEFNILVRLARNPGQTFSRAQLLDLNEDLFSDSMERSVDVHIRNLRTKLEPDPQKPRYILTVFGIGYRLDDCMETRGSMG